ncbi:ankyrin, partial [Microthyrium microscopicum]
ELDQEDNGGFTPLQKASLSGHYQVVQFLLEKGCRRDSCSKEDLDTPLIDAVENAHLDVIELLLENGVNPHHANRHGKRAID